jgi:hypothetical protein
VGALCLVPHWKNLLMVTATLTSWPPKYVGWTILAIHHNNVE